LDKIIAGGDIGAFPKTDWRVSFKKFLLTGVQLVCRF